MDTRTNQLVDAPQRIIGVVEDNLYGSMRQRPGPELYMNYTFGVPYRLVKYEAASASSLQARLDELGQRMFGTPPQVLVFLETTVQSVFQWERNESMLLMISGSVALLLACIGLYGLAAFAMERRAKEIGVRTVMGAEPRALLAMYLWRFSRPVLLANLVAWPVALWFTLQWIERFPYQLDKAWLLPLCAGATLMVLLVAMLTVGYITLRATSANPAKALRYE